MDAEAETADLVARRAEVEACTGPVDRARALTRLALALRAHRRFSESAEQAEAARQLFLDGGVSEAAAVCRRLRDEMDLTQARADHDAAVALLADAANLSVARDLLRDVRRVFVRGRMPEAAATCAFNLAFVLHELGDLDDAVEELQQARTIFAGLGCDAEVAGCNQNLGVLLADQGRHVEALHQLEEARAAFEAVGRTESAAECDANLAVLHRQLGYVERAAEYEARARQEGLDPAALG